MFHFYTTWKRKKTFGFLTFSRGIEMEHWAKMSENFEMWIACECIFEVMNCELFDNEIVCEFKYRTDVNRSADEKLQCKF